MDTPAHKQHFTHSYWVTYPEHAPRQQDPHYRDFEAYHRKNRPTARCAMGQRLGYRYCADEHGQPAQPNADGFQPGLELHHAHVEFALQNAVDLALLEHDYPGISNPDQVGAWVESGPNFMWLCVLPDTPVLLADGTEKAIREVRRGDSVIGHDGRCHAVTAAGSRPYSGSVVRWGCGGVTASHEVLTERGWLPAGQVGDEIGVMTAQVFGVRFDQFKVLDPVIASVPVEMVNSFRRQQRTSEVPLHDHTMLHHIASTVPNPDIALPRELWGLVADVPFGKVVQGDHPTSVGTVLALPRFHAGAERHAAYLASDVRCPTEESGARLTAHGSRVTRQWAPAIDARSGGRHNAIFYHGPVFDLTVEGSHSFFAGGVAVHNCSWHHRGAAGVHSATASDFEAEHYVRNLISKTE